MSLKLKYDEKTQKKMRADFKAFETTPVAPTPDNTKLKASLMASSPWEKQPSQYYEDNQPSEFPFCEKEYVSILPNTHFSQLH